MGVTTNKYPFPFKVIKNPLQLDGSDGCAALRRMYLKPTTYTGKKHKFYVVCSTTIKRSTRPPCMDALPALPQRLEHQTKGSQGEQVSSRMPP